MFAVWADDAVAVENGAVEQVKDVARDNWAECHKTPVLAQAMDAKCLCNDGREDAKEESVSKTGEPGNKAKEAWTGDVKRTELRDEEDEACEYKTPDAAGLENLDKKVGSDTCANVMLVKEDHR